MKRRIALKNMAMAAGGLLSLPAWANGWNKAAVLSVQPFLSPKQDEVLAEIVETIIPVTDTPGAKALHVHTFIQKMVADCYEKDIQENLVNGIKTLENRSLQNHVSSFTACNTAQRISLLTSLEQSTEPGLKEFYSLVKDLTIQGYMTSEYVMTNLTHYTMVPGHYYGCVPLATK